MFNSKIYTRIPTCRLVSLVFVCFLTTGCATILKGTNQEIPISSDPSGADIFVDGNLVGTTPADVQIKRKRDHLVEIKKTGYQPKSVPVVKNVGGAVWGNILAGGLIGWGVDAATGAQNNLTPKTIYVRLEPVGEGGQTTDSSQDSSVGIKKLNDLDQMRENKQITDEEYTRGRIALIEQYFPELMPETDEGDAAKTDEGDAAKTDEGDAAESGAVEPDQ